MGCNGSKISQNENPSDGDIISDNSIHVLTHLSTSNNSFPPISNSFSDQLQIFEYKFLHRIGNGQKSTVYLVERIDTKSKFAAKVYHKNIFCSLPLNNDSNNNDSNNNDSNNNDSNNNDSNNNDSNHNENNGNHKNNEKMDAVIQEIHIMATVKHPNILPIIELLDDDNISCLIFIMPFADQGHLLPMKDKIHAENEAKTIFFQICKGLQYLHSKNILHHDIKPENVLLFSDGTAVLSDFSHSITLDSSDDIISTTKTTIPFCSPESLSNMPYHGKKHDIWSLGITLYFMIFGHLPFFDVDENLSYVSQLYKITQQIRNDPVEYDSNTNISDDLQDLFLKVLEKDYKLRVDIDAILDHPWLNNVSTENS